MSAFSDLCLREVIDSHRLIEQWLGHADCPENILSDLVTRFAPTFSMISPNGARMPEGAFGALFGSLRGARPNLRILIDELVLIHHDNNAVCVSYRESQQWDTGATQRRATALFVLEGDRTQWQHLHETWAISPTA